MVKVPDIYYSQGNVVVRRSVMSDIDALAPNLRESDKQEIFYSHHSTPRSALYNGITHSVLCLTIEDAGQPIAMFGLSPDTLLGNTAVVWLLGSNSIEKRSIRFFRAAKGIITIMVGLYPYIHNFTHAENKKAIIWLKFLGFTIEEAKPYGIEGKNFHYFYYHRN